MNRTNTIPRYGLREVGEYYPTPPEFVRGSLQAMWDMDRTGPMKCLDVAAGKGEFANEWLNLTGIQADGFDLMPRPRGFKGRWYRDDFLNSRYGGTYDRIFMNPPFTLSMPFIHRAFDWLTYETGILGCFARISFLEGQDRYEELWKDWKPAKVIIFDARIRNVGRSSDSIGRCFIIWQFRSSKSTELVWHKI